MCRPHPYILVDKETRGNVVIFTPWLSCLPCTKIKLSVLLGDHAACPSPCLICLPNIPALLILDHSVFTTSLSTTASSEHCKKLKRREEEWRLEASWSHLPYGACLHTWRQSCQFSQWWGVLLVPLLPARGSVILTVAIYNVEVARYPPGLPNS